MDKKFEICYKVVIIYLCKKFYNSQLQCKYHKNRLKCLLFNKMEDL